MKKVFEVLNYVVQNAPTIKHYAKLVIHAVDMLDGVQDWQLENKPESKPAAVSKKK